MAEINHRYLKDNDGDTFYPVTHIDAVQGMESMETNIDDLMSFKETVIGNTGWVDFEFIPEIRKNNKQGNNGFKCGLKEVRFGDIRRSEEHTSELQSRFDLVCRLLL